jgi:sugar phosphate isomerase/epimerase
MMVTHDSSLSPARGAPGFTCSFVSTMFPEATLDALITTALEVGASALELRCAAGHGHRVDIDLVDSERVSFRQTLTASSITISDLASPARIGSAPIELFEAYLRLADDLGVPGVRVFCDDPKKGEERGAWLHRVQSASHALSEALGAPAAARLWIENHGATSTVDSLLEAAGRDFGFVWDVGHSSSHGEAPGEVWERIGRRVRHVHVKDWRRKPEGGWDRACRLLEGDLHIAVALQLLTAEGYQGCVSVEVPSPGGPEDLRRLVGWRERATRAPL